MHQQYYDTNDDKVKTWQEQAAPSERFPYGLGMDDTDFLRGRGIYPYREDRPEYDSNTQELVSAGTMAFRSTEVVLRYEVVDLPAEQVREFYAKQIREERDRRVAATDYLMVTDYPLSEYNRAAFADYRQALRDVPSKLGFPWAGPLDPSCIWPDKPTL